MTLRVRRLEKEDDQKGFFELLSQLTIAPKLETPLFQTLFKKLDESYCICVIEDSPRGLVATGTLFVEQKFIRNGGRVGHIEDVVVHSAFRGKNLGKKIVRHLMDVAKERGCYKVILDCSKENIPFYKKLGFEEKDVHMALYL